MSNSPTTASDLFDTLVPMGLAFYPEKAREVNAIFGFEIEGEGGGVWTLDCTSTPPQIHKGVFGTPQCTIALAHDDFKRCMVDQNVGIKLYFDNKIRVSGNANAALKLGLFFDITRLRP